MTSTSTSDFCFATATELARRIRDREISSAEVTEAFMARIAAHNSTLNAVVQLFEPEARSRAKEADEALARGQIWGPLHGVPVTIKEMFLIANTPSTLNSKRMKDFIASEDGVLVRRIKAAGAVILGKTNVPANLQGYQCKGDIYPECKNPYQLERSPGGSTGGGAAAVAAGMTALELGADGGGSPRVPAHFCGVFCLKQTDKTTVRYGGMPLPKEARGFLVNMGQPGPLSRSIDDLESHLFSMAQCGPTTNTAGPTLRRSTRAAIRRWSCRSARRRTDFLGVQPLVGIGRNPSSCTSRGSWPR